mmetsp:Transcript_47860/g.109121  ORF Transcript_47860/g.109121 Transcript_47860/m.109121 type:complete len:203 (-) Transcript_47860:362-970(-)
MSWSTPLTRRLHSAVSTSRECLSAAERVCMWSSVFVYASSSRSACIQYSSFASRSCTLCAFTAAFRCSSPFASASTAALRSRSREYCRSMSTRCFLRSLHCFVSCMMYSEPASRIFSNSCRSAAFVSASSARCSASSANSSGRLPLLFRLVLASNAPRCDADAETNEPPGGADNRPLRACAVRLSVSSSPTRGGRDVPSSPP